MTTFKKLFNIIAMFLIVIGAIMWGIWGFFQIEVFVAFFGQTTARVLYSIIGIFGLYGMHLFIEFAKREWQID